MPNDQDRIIAEDPFNRRLSGVRKGRPTTTDQSRSLMGRKPNKPDVEAMLGGFQKADIPILKEGEEEPAPLAPDIQEQLKALAQMPVKAPPKPRAQPHLPPNAPPNPLKPAIDGKPELLGQNGAEEPQLQGQGETGSQGQAQDQILSPARAAQQDKIERTYFYDQQIPTIYNFRHSMKMLEREVKRASRHQRPLSVCIITFHELELIRGHFGELAVDAALQNLGKILAHYIDLDMEIAGRFENKIIVVLPEFMAPNAAQLMDEIRRALETSILQFRQYKFSLIASIGVASFPTHGTSWKELLVKAEQASEQAIERGGNTIAFPPRA
ncbi:MAG: GGDEF domain-containing protein [Cyanobacteria bacterium HKST-UBA01]|nr:GGDEF domain-containing protein [Cyanobacteria bacterium HKST-UBA01]